MGIIDEFLIAIGVKADTAKLKEFEKGLDDVSDAAEDTESSMLKAYDATDSFVSAIEGVLGVIGFFTGAIGGAWAVFHGTIMELEELIEEEKLLHKVTKDQLEQQKKYKESVETLGKRFQSLKVEMAFGFLPTMQKMVTWLDNFLKKNKDLIVNGIGRLLDFLVRTIQVGINFVRFLDRIIGSTIGWKNALLILVAVLAIVKRATIAAFITNPIFWVMAAIAGLLLLIDDFMTYMDGGDSLFGEYWGELIKWVEKAKDVWNNFSDDTKSAIKALAIGFAMLIPMFGGLFGTIKTLASGFMLLSRVMLMNPIGFVATLIGVLIYFIIDLIKWLDGGESKFGELWQTIADVWNNIVDATSRAIEKMINAVSGFIDDVKTYFSGVFDAITQPFANAFSWVQDKWRGLKGMFSSGVNANVNINGATAARVGNVANSRISTSTTSVSAPISIYGSTNPIGTANAIGGHLNKTAKLNTTSMVAG